MSKPTFDNRNENRISIKTDSTVKLIKELSKLGVFKSKKKPKRRVDTGMEGIKQDNVMVGYTKSLGGPLGPQMRNIPPIQQIQAGMSPQQIEDIQRTNAARFAALQGEVDQHRSETRQTIGGLAGAAARKFSQLDSAVSGIVNVDSEHFRGSTFPASSRGDQPIDPFYYARSGMVPPERWLPDTNDVPMDQTLNEGGPQTTAQFATTLYPPEEETNSGISSSQMGRAEDEITASGGGGGKRIYTGGELPEGVAFLEVGDVLPKTRIQPQERIRKTRTKNEQRNFIANSWGLSPVPDEKSSRDDFRKYYFDLALAANEDINPNLKTKDDYIREIKALLDIVGTAISSEK